MAASSPRKPRRTRGRHRKATSSPAANCVQWLRVGAVGIGLAAAVAGGQGVASASTDDSSSSADSSASADSATSAGDADDTNAGPSAAADDDADDTHSRTTKRTVVRDATDDENVDTAAGGSEDDETEEASPADTSDPDEAQTPPAEVDDTDTAAAPTPTPDTAETAAPDEPEAETTEVAAPTALAAASVTAAAAPEPGTSAWYFQGVLQRALYRLTGWPGIPKNFVDITNYQTDQTLDNADNQLDYLSENAPFGSQARWLPDLIGIISFFFVPVPQGSTFTDKLNAMGDFLNRVVPPFTIEPGADTLDVITPYKIMGAAVVGTATVLQDMLNGIYDPQQWAIHVVKATTGATITASDLSDFTSLSTKVAAAQAGAIATFGLIDGGAYYDPERAFEVTLPNWTAQQVNPFTVMTYIGLVGIYKRFQEMAVLTQFTTSTTYESWLYTISLGSQSTRSQYAAGSFHAIDPDGNSADFGVSLGGTYISAGGALVTINTVNGGYTYTNTLPGAAFFHRATSENPEDRFDTVQIPVKSVDGVEYTLTFKIQIIDGTNANPTGSSTVTGTDAAGVVKGKVTGADSDGDTLTYTLVGSSVNGLSGNSAYTKNGAGNGGIVTINSTTGDFTYVSTSTASATQSFQVRIGDGHGGSTIVTVTVPNTTSITPANVNTSTQNVVTGTVPTSTNSPGVFTSYALGTAPTKGTVTSFNPATGAFTYTRNAALGHTTTPNDFVTIIATDANGRTVTLRMPVVPTVANNAPTVVLTTAPTVGTLVGTTQTSTGKVTYADADGDAPIWPSSVTTARGGTVTFAADGTFTYTSNLTIAQRHAVARIGAAGSTYNSVALAAYEDAFTVIVSDGFGGTAQTTIKVPIYAINANPTMSTGSPGCFVAVCTVGGINVDDADGDLDGYFTLPTSNDGTGNAWFTLTAGSMTIWGGDGVGTTTISWGGNTNGLGTQVTVTNTLTIYDGHYRVTNGVVDTSYPARVWKTWSSSGTSTGN